MYYLTVFLSCCRLVFLALNKTLLFWSLSIQQQTFVLFRTQFTVCIILHHSLVLVLTSNVENICGNHAKKNLLSPQTLLQTIAYIWLYKAAKKCIHYHESQIRLPPALWYQWEYCKHLPRIGAESAGLMQLNTHPHYKTTSEPDRRVQRSGWSGHIS